MNEISSEAVDNLEGLEARQESNKDMEHDINICENKIMKFLQESLEESLEEAFAPFKKQLGNFNRELCLLQNIKKEEDNDRQDSSEKNAENNKDNENTDNIEAAKIWAVNQKQSIKGSHQTVQ